MSNLTAQPDPAGAEIFDRGYRPYDGPRTGAAGASRSVMIASVQRALGMRRKFRFKIIPLLTIAIAYIPALVFMGLGILFPEEIASEVVADYASYFGLLNGAMMLFTAFVAPELLSTDRNTGLFGLYLASPLNRVSYLAAKAAALIGVLFLVSLFPVLFLLLGYTFGGLGPDGFVETLKIIGRIVASGFLMSVFYAVLGMAAATLTKRQGFASTGIVAVLLGSGFLAGGLVEGAGMDEWYGLFGLPVIPIGLAGVIFGVEMDDLGRINDWAVVAAWLIVVAVCVATIAFGYRRMQVTR